ncbi:MAG: DHH family phosphoesterase [Lachnospiraceae bacterium]|nr:DHH family phosphoesterase [Lachnospiraceae bacterium]
MELVELYTLIEFCKNKRTYIQTHNIPDPDAIGAAFGLQQLFLQLGLETTLCYDGNMDKLSASKMLKEFNIIMFSKTELEGVLTNNDCIICVDSQPFGGNITDLTGIEIAAIDHHPMVEQTLNTNFVFKDIRKVGACCSIIAEYYTLLEKEPDKTTATALLHGIKMDTLNFTRGVTDLDIKMFRFLNKLADNSMLIQLDTNTLAFSDLKSYSSAISNIQVFGTLGISHIPFPCPDSMVAIVADFILSLIEIEVAVIYNDRADGTKFSVRSERPDVDAGKLVSEALFGLGRGGGHATMAGGFVPAEMFATLGSYKNNAINERFINAMKSIM